ncbi:MAG: AAA family ATPase [Mariniphaga sp.]
MKRDVIQLLTEWKSRVNRKPLLVRGARQVGKTFAVNEFGTQQFASFVSINLEESPEYKSMFKTNNPKSILKELSVLKNTDIIPGQTLLFIDEIQACPEAIVCLRYFYEQMPELHVIAAGSLLDHTLSEIQLSMPVGRVEFCYMYPMSFTEFLQALSEDKLLAYISAFTFGEPFSEAIHLKLLDLMRYYIFIGGMPEAVKAFVESQKLLDIERIQSSILTSLKYDFAKYGSKSQQWHLISVLNFVAQNTGKKIKYVNIDKEVRSVNLKEAFYKLEMSRVVSLVKHTASAGVPLTTHLNPDIFKAFFLDIGLANHLCKMQLIDPLNILSINEGALAEQFACQELLTLSTPFDEPQLYYWVRDEKNANAEIDFIFQHNNVTYPVEVKAGKTGTLKSMHVYLLEKKLETGIRLNTDMPSVGAFTTKVRSGITHAEITFQLLSLPLYMSSQLPRLLSSLRM